MAGRAERPRLFFAVPLADELRDAAGRLQEELARACRSGPRVRWVERANVHLTLKFLGDTPAEALTEIARAADRVAAAAGPMSLEVAGAGCFPPRGAPRTIWVGLARDCAALITLAESLDRALAEAGLAKAETRPFHAHFTLGRVKDRGGGRELREAIERLSHEPVGEMQVDHFVLLSSDLTPTGPVYTERGRFGLGA